MVHGLCVYLCLWYDCIRCNQFVNVNENDSQLEGEAMTEDEILNQLVNILCSRSLECYDIESAKEIRMMVAEYQHELFIRRFFK
jgi:hypothetical protein